MIIILVWGCGQRGSPTGGDKDVTPPRVLKSVPDSLGLNFTGKELSWKFDEYVTISGINNEILISPPVKTKPTVKLIGKKLVLKFDSTLAPNTTYSVFLGKGVKDLNEGNPLENNLLVFSTGAVIDSLSIHGEIYDAKSMQTLTEGMVHLYKNLNDSAPATEIPSYFAKIENGHFHFTNLAAGTYKIIGLTDKNGNSKYDLPNESIAFYKENIEVTASPNQEEIILKSFSTENTKQYIAGSGCDFKGKFHIEFSQPVKDFAVELENVQFKKEWNIKQWNANKDSLILWSSEIEALDSAKLIVSFDGNQDTIKFNLKRRKPMNSQKLNGIHNFTGLGHFHKKKFEINFSQPISSYDTSKIMIIGGGDSTYAKLSSASNDLRTFQLNHNLKEMGQYRLVFLPNALQSIFKVSNPDTLIFPFSTLSNMALGNLKIKYDFSAIQESGILQVYHEDNLVSERVIDSKSGQWYFEGTKPGNYKLKFIADENKDGKWTPGDYWKKIQPEMVYWYEESINLRANWDLDIEWVLTP